MNGILPLFDDRHFGLHDLRHGHSYVLIRGFPRTDDDECPLPGAPVIDFVFGGVSRISCSFWFTPMLLRVATTAEATELDRRLTRPIGRRTVFLLEPDSIDSYVLASDLAWAEFDIAGGAPCPLVGNADYRAAHPALDGVRRYLRPTG